MPKAIILALLIGGESSSLGLVHAVLFPDISRLTEESLRTVPAADRV